MSGWQLMKESKSRIASSRVGLPLGSNSSSIPDLQPQGSLSSKTPTPMNTTTGFSLEVRPGSPRPIRTSSNSLKPRELTYRRPDALPHTRTYNPIKHGASPKETAPLINNNSITNTSTRSRQGPCSQSQSDVNVSVSSCVGLDDSCGGHDSILNATTEGSIIGGTSESLVSNGLPYNKDLYVFNDRNDAGGEKTETVAEGSELTSSGQSESRRGSNKSIVGHTDVSSFFKGKSRLLSRSSDHTRDRRPPTPTAKLSAKGTQSAPSVRVASQRISTESLANHAHGPRNMPSDLHQLSPASIGIVNKDAQSTTAMGSRGDSSLYSEINVRSTRALDAVRAQYSKLHEALRHRAFVREQCRLRGVDADDLAASLRLSSEPNKDEVKTKNIKVIRRTGTASSPLNGSFGSSSSSSASESVHGGEAGFKSADSEGTRYKSTLAKAFGLGGKKKNTNGKSEVKDSIDPLRGLDFSSSSSSGEEGGTILDSVDRNRHAVLPSAEVTDGDVSFELTAQHVQNLMRERTTRRQQRRQQRAVTKARERQVRIMQLLRESHGFRELFEGIGDDYVPEEALEVYLRELKRRRRKRQEAEERAMVKVGEDGRRVYKDHVGSAFIPPTTVAASLSLSKHQISSDSQSKMPHGTDSVVSVTAGTSGGAAAATMASVVGATEGISLVSGHDEQVQERIFRAAVPKLGPLPPPLPTDTSSEQTNDQHREYNALITKLYTEPPTPRLTTLTLLREKAFNSVELQALLADIAHKQLIEDTRVRTRGDFESNEEEMRYVLGLRPRRISGGAGGKSSDQRKLMGFRSTTTDKTYRDLERRDRKAQRGGVSSSSSSSISSEDSCSSSSSSLSLQGELDKSSQSLVMHGTSPRSKQRKPLDAKDYVHSFLDRRGANDLFEHRSEAEEAVRSIPPIMSSHRGNSTTQVSVSQIATRHLNDHGAPSQNTQRDEGKKTRRSSKRRGVEEGADDEDVCDVSEYLDETGIEEYTEERRRELNDLVFGNSVEELLKRLFKSYKTTSELRMLLGKVQTQHAGYVTKEQDRYVEFMNKVKREAQERIDKAEAALKEIKERMARETRELTQRLVESESDAEKMRKANLASAAKSKESIDGLEKRVRELEASTAAIQTATTVATEAHTVTVKDLRSEVEELTYENRRFKEHLDVSERDNAFLTECLQAVLDTVALPERCDFRGKPLSETFAQLQRRDTDESKCTEKNTAKNIPSRAQQYPFMFVPPSKAPLYTNGVPRILLNLPVSEYRLVRKEFPPIGFSDGACQVDVVDLTGEKAPEEQLVEVREKLVASEQERGKLKAVEVILKETVITNTVLTERIERQTAEHERLTGVHKRSVQKMIRNIGEILLLKARTSRQTRQLSSQRAYIKEIVDENEWLREKLRGVHRKRQRKRPLYDLGSDTDVEVAGARPSGGNDADEYDIADASTQKSLDESFVAGAFAYSLSACERAEQRANPQPSDFRLIPVSVIRHQASFGSSPSSRHADIPTAKTIMVKVSRYNEAGTSGMPMQRVAMPPTCTAAVAPPTPPISSLLASTKGAGFVDGMSTCASPISASFRPPPLVAELTVQTEPHEQLAPNSFVLSSTASTTTRSTSPHPPLPQGSPSSSKFEATPPMLAAYRRASGSGDTPPKGSALLPLSPSSPSLANLPLINRTTNENNASVAEKQSSSTTAAADLDMRAPSHARLLGWNSKGIQCVENDIELAMLGVNAVSNKARSKRMEELRSTLSENRGKTSTVTALKVIAAVASMRTPSASSLSVQKATTLQAAYGSSKAHTVSKKHSQRVQPQSLAEDINNPVTSTTDNMSFGSSFPSSFAGVGAGDTAAPAQGLDYVSDVTRDEHTVDDRNIVAAEQPSVSKGEGRRPNTASSLSGKRVDATGRHASKALSRPVSASGNATFGGGGKMRGLSNSGNYRISLNSSLPSMVSRLGPSQFVPLKGETENVLHGDASQLEIKGLPPPAHDAEAILSAAPPTQFSILNNKVSQIINSQNNHDVSYSRESELAWFESSEKADGRGARRGVSHLPLPTGSIANGPSGRAGHRADDESFYNSHPLYGRGDDGVRTVAEATAEALGGKKPRNMNAIGTLRQNPSRPFSASSLIRSSGAARISRAGGPPDDLTALTMSSTSAQRSDQSTNKHTHSFVSSQSVLAPTSFPTTSELEQSILHSEARRRTVPPRVHTASVAAVSHSSPVDDGGGVTFNSVSEGSGGKEGWARSTGQNQTHDPSAIAAIVRRHRRAKK